jgi:hypothetical protein
MLQVLAPVIRDLKSLEQGVDGLKAGIVAYCADNLEAHDLGMFQRNFNSGNICRFCHILHRFVLSFDEVFAE